MRIRLVAEASHKIERLFKVWGLSVLIDDDILFDTFSDEAILRRNVKRFGIDIGKVKHVVISHEHWDHTGGLRWVLSNVSNAIVYICAGSGEQFKEKVASSGASIAEVSGPVRIRENVFSAGRLETLYKGKVLVEQSLLIGQNDTRALVTGCSHPGIVETLTHARTLSDSAFGLVAGGFHLHDKSGEDIARTIESMTAVGSIRKIAPMHCTGKVAVRAIRKKMPGAFLKLRAGDSLVFDSSNDEWVREKHPGKLSRSKK